MTNLNTMLIEPSSNNLKQQIKEKLLVELQPFSHGAWAHININRVALFLRNVQEATAPHQYDRFRAALKEFLENVYPRLMDIARQFQLLSFDPKTVQILTFNVQELAAMARPLSLSPAIKPEDIRKYEETIPQHVDQLLLAFRAMRSYVLNEFRCKPDNLLQAIIARQSTMTPNVTYAIAKPLTQEEPAVIVSDIEFSRIMETLIHYSVEQAHENKKLLFAAEIVGTRWELEMRDSTLYLEPQQWGALFTPAENTASATELSKLPELLKKYDGDISIKESAETGGTTFLLRLQVATP